MIFLFQIYLLYFTVLLNLFSHSKMLCDFFAASQSESIEFHAIWLCHDQTELLQITSKEARTKNDKLIIYCSISAAFPWNMNPREVLHIQYYIYKWWYFWYLLTWYLTTSNFNSKHKINIIFSKINIFHIEAIPQATLMLIM